MQTDPITSSSTPAPEPASAAPIAAVDAPPNALAVPRASYVFLIVATVLSAVADQVTKGWVKMNLAGFDPKSVSPRKIALWHQHIDLVFAQNPGGAWSFLRSLPEVLRRPFFLVISAAAIVFIV